MDKVNKPALAAKISGVKNIIGPGIGNQKKYLTTSLTLSDKDWKLNYSEQSQKLLKLHDIKLDNQYLELKSGKKLPLQAGMSLNANIKLRKVTYLKLLLNKFGDKADSLKSI